MSRILSRIYDFISQNVPDFLQVEVVTLVTAVPIKDKGFYLNKSEFWDAIYLRYGFQFKMIPSSCCCGKFFSMEHALTCLRGGFIAMRHNIIRDTTAELLNEVCKDVRTEPKLMELTGERFKYKTANSLFLATTVLRYPREAAQNTENQLINRRKGAE